VDAPMYAYQTKIEPPNTYFSQRLLVLLVIATT
jgi:hypothetical protein